MAHPEKVEIRIRRILGPGGETAVAHSVYCPIQHESKLLVDCETCDRCTELTPEASFVVCEVPGDDSTAPAQYPRAITEQITVGEVMTREAMCVTADFNVAALRELLIGRNISGVPVVDAQGFPMGVVSKTDLLRERSVPESRATAGELMMPVAFTLEESRPLADAVTLMSIEGVHRLPIVDQNGRVVGILSTMDVLRWLDR